MAQKVKPKSRYIPFEELLERARSARTSDFFTTTPAWCQEVVNTFATNGEIIPDKLFRIKLAKAVVIIEKANHKLAKDVTATKATVHQDAHRKGKTARDRAKKKYYCPCVPKDKFGQPTAEPECSNKPAHDRKVRASMGGKR